MDIKIGLIGSTTLIKRISEKKHILPKDCKVSLLPYQKVSEIVDVFNNNLHKVDGYILGGELVNVKITPEMQKLKLCRTLTVTNEALYSLLLKIVAETGSADFSRIYIDFLTTGNNFMGLKEILPKENFPKNFQAEITDNVYNMVLNQHKKLVQENAIDISITRLGNIENEIAALGVKTYYLSPTEKQVIEAIDKILLAIKATKFDDNLIAVADISLNSSSKTSYSFNFEEEMKLLNLNKCLLEYENSKSLPNSISRTSNHFELIISKKIFNKITNEMSCDELLDYLRNNGCKVNIGWGIGGTLAEARRRAKNANIEASRLTEESSFLLNELDQLLGPLGNIFKNELPGSNKEWWTVPPKSFVGISDTTILKLSRVMSQLNKKILSSEEVASHLGITLRSANRLLNKLCESGGAVVKIQSSEKLVGRPRKLYEIDL